MWQTSTAEKLNYQELTTYSIPHLGLTLLCVNPQSYRTVSKDSHTSVNHADPTTRNCDEQLYRAFFKNIGRRHKSVSLFRQNKHSVAKH